MKNEALTLAEGMQLHELLTIKNLSLTKSTTMLPLISDTELKDILKQSIKLSTQEAESLKKLIETNSVNMY